MGIHLSAHTAIVDTSVSHDRACHSLAIDMKRHSLMVQWLDKQNNMYHQRRPTRVGVKYNWSSTQIRQELVIKYKYTYFAAFSPIKYSSTSSTDTPSTSTSVNIRWLILILI